jgi:prepilin peptidase dependent protein B
MLSPSSRRLPRQRHAQHGLSIVELLVGAAVGMVVISGAAMLTAKNLYGSRLVIAEARLNEDLRNAADLLTRDLRRAGYWGNAVKGTIAQGATSVTSKNPYSPASAATGNSQLVSYGFSRETSVDDDAQAATETFGFRLEDNALQMDKGGGWTDVTDKTSVKITKFSITPTERTISLGQYCATVCAAGSVPCPKMKVSSYAVLIEGTSVRDSDIKRSLRSSVRVRNDSVESSCPP